ncbi:MAG: hypothetical protein F4185_02980 [Chloroflexi bacterium]|nr:hypothetical protein [Chloroflexota bacterium]MYF64920.1 hypothetical protein [Chloroflexota bacterium]MYK35207.1 hypothetical protein [Chloroflexota bacterium]
MSSERGSSALYTPGIALLPDDFPHRLTALKETTGLTWEGMACSIGVDPRQLQQWRRGGWPNGGAMLALVDLATLVPGGLGILLGCDLLVIRRHGPSSGEREGAAA